jgi:hypothetical protein
MGVEIEDELSCVSLVATKGAEELALWCHREARFSDVTHWLHTDGWFEVRTRGSHRQFKHFFETRPRHSSWEAQRRLGARDAQQYSQTGWPQTKVIAMRYAIVIEQGETNLSAYVPDLPGREDGTPIPPATSRVDYVDVAA